jgi:hypothetical protein
MKRAPRNPVSVLDHRTTAIVALVALLLLVRAVRAQTGNGPEQPVSGAVTGYDLSWWSVDGGGATFKVDGGYTLSSTAGQPDTAVWSGDGYVLAGGFWSGTAVEYHVYLPLILRNYR